jgi:hypothetical protein
VETGINRSISINCLVDKCPFPAPNGHHHERRARICITCIASFLYLCSLKTCGFLASLTQLLKLFSQAAQKSLHVKPVKRRGKVGRAVQPNISTHVARAGGQSLVCSEGRHSLSLLHRKKRFASFPSPDGMSLPNSP